MPTEELWLHTPELRASLDRGLDWSEKNPRRETDLAEIAARIRTNEKDSQPRVSLA